MTLELLVFCGLAAAEGKACAAPAIRDPTFGESTGLRRVSNRRRPRLEMGDGRLVAGNWHGWGCEWGEEPPPASKKKRPVVIVQISDTRIPHIYSVVN